MNRGIGVDFGSSGSRVAIDDGSGPRLLFTLPASAGRVVKTQTHGTEDDAQAVSCGGCLRVETLKTVLGRVQSGQDTYSKLLQQAEYDAVAHFRALKGEMEEQLEATVTGVTVAAPSVYPMAQRAALRLAAQSAGFEHVSLLDEPLAASLATYACTEPAGRVLVIALGRSVFSASAIAVTENGIDGLAHEGSVHLGGDALDAVILGAIVDEFRGEPRAMVCSDPAALDELRSRVEAARLSLATADEVDVEVGPGRDSSGRKFHGTFHLDRDRLEELLGPLVARMMEHAEEVLDVAEWQPDSLGGVLVLGAAVQMPAVLTALGEVVGPDLTPATPEAVAFGAARYAATVMDCWRPQAAEENEQRQVAGDTSPADMAQTAAGVEVPDAPAASPPPPAEAQPEVAEDDVLAALGKVRDALAARKTERALLAYEDLLQRAERELSFLYSRRASELRAEGLLPEAQLRLERAHHYNSDSAHIRTSLSTVHFDQAGLYAQMQQWSACKQHLRQSLLYDPGNLGAQELQQELAATRREAASKRGKKQGRKRGKKS